MNKETYKKLFFECFDSPYDLEAIEALGVSTKQFYRRFSGEQQVTREAERLILYVSKYGPEI